MEIDLEVWTDIYNYIDLYQVSNLGRVKSLKRESGNYSNNKDRLLKLCKGKIGYLTVALCKDKKRTTFNVHKLVIESFIGLRKGLYVDHIDNDRTNNNIINLRYVSCSENNYNRIKQANCSSKLKGVYWHKAAKKWCAELNFEKEKHYLGLYDSEIEAGKAYNKTALEFFGKYAKLNEV